MATGAVEGSEKKPRRSTATKRTTSVAPRKRATKTAKQSVSKKATTIRATKTTTRSTTASKARKSTGSQQDSVPVHQKTSAIAAANTSEDFTTPQRRAPTNRVIPHTSVWARVPYSLYATTGTALVLLGVGVGIGISDPGVISVQAVTDQYNQQITSQQREEGSTEQAVPVQDSETRVNQPRLRPPSRAPAATPAATTETEADVATSTATTTGATTSETLDEDVTLDQVDISTEEGDSGEETGPVIEE